MRKHEPSSAAARLGSRRLSRRMVQQASLKSKSKAQTLALLSQLNHVPQRHPGLDGVMPPYQFFNSHQWLIVFQELSNSRQSKPLVESRFEGWRLNQDKFLENFLLLNLFRN